MDLEDLECETCHQKFSGEVKIFHIGDVEKRLHPHECPTCKAKTEERERLEEEGENRLRLTALRDKWRRSSGVPQWMITKTFDNFEVALQKTAYKVTYDYASGLNLEKPLGYPSVILYSEGNGVGKTHLAIAIANLAIDNWNGNPDCSVCPIRFESGPGLIRRIRATYNVGPYAGHEKEEDVYNELRGAKLLILDDVGKEKPSEHTREVYFYIIDERYKAGWPVVITSNLPLDGQLSLCDLMGASTIDRLIGMSRGKVIKLRGKSYRQLRKQP